MNTEHKRPVNCVADLEELNRSAGQHFFDADTKKFFASRISDRIVGGRFFLTTEKTGFGSTERRATLRMIRDDGSVETLGEGLGSWADSRSAWKALDKARKAVGGSDRGTLARGGVQVRFDPYTDHDGELIRVGQCSERELFRSYHWRAYVGEIPIGVRTSRADARQIAREAVNPCPVR